MLTAMEDPGLGEANLKLRFLVCIGHWGKGEKQPYYVMFTVGTPKVKVKVKVNCLIWGMGKALRTEGSMGFLFCLPS